MHVQTIHKQTEYAEANPNQARCTETPSPRLWRGSTAVSTGSPFPTSLHKPRNTPVSKEAGMPHAMAE